MRLGREFPLICVLLALALVLVAMRLYPGGDWWRTYLTNLFRPVAVNGEVNTARPYAIAGMWLFCLGMAELFRQLAQGMKASKHGTWVRILGIAAMVYAGFTVTRMHDLMVTISAGFFIAVEMVLLDWLWRRRQMAEWMAGMATLVVALTACFVYYGQVGLVALPTLQKLTFLSSVSWLFWLHRRGPHSSLPVKI